MAAWSFSVSDRIIPSYLLHLQWWYIDLVPLVLKKIQNRIFIYLSNSYEEPTVCQAHWLFREIQGCVSRKGQLCLPRVSNLRGCGRKTRVIFMYDFKLWFKLWFQIMLLRNEGLDDCVLSGQDTVMVRAEGGGEGGGWLWERRVWVELGHPRGKWWGLDSDWWLHQRKDHFISGGDFKLCSLNKNIDFFFPVKGITVQ